jgi:hypothetical protein
MVELAGGRIVAPEFAGEGELHRAQAVARRRREAFRERLLGAENGPIGGIARQVRRYSLKS